MVDMAKAEAAVRAGAHVDDADRSVVWVPSVTTQDTEGETAWRRVQLFRGHDEDGKLQSWRVCSCENGRKRGGDATCYHVAAAEMLPGWTAATVPADWTVVTEQEAVSAELDDEPAEGEHLG